MSAILGRTLLSGLRRKVCQNSNPLTSYWPIRTQVNDSAAYDGDGKTTIKVLNRDDPRLILVDAYSHRGFRLSNHLMVAGSIILFPTHVYSWAVSRGKDITPDSLLVFELIVPKVKIVVIGYGEQGEAVDASLVNHLKSRGISCELLPTPHAVTTYNYLVSDAVHVAGAFVPVKSPVSMESRDEEAITKLDMLTKPYKDVADPNYRRLDIKEAGKKHSLIVDRDKGKKNFDDEL